MIVSKLFSCCQIYKGETIFQKLRNQNIDCSYIHSGSPNQDTVASKWNNNQLQILITTTLGLVGNESRRTQMVCIVGMHYNLPSIIQAYGRIRPKRRTTMSECLIFTSNNNYQRLIVAKEESSNAFNLLVGSGIIGPASKDVYNKSMTMHSVNEWLFKDQGCRLVSLAGRIGFRHDKCRICDMCTNTSVNRSAMDREKRKRNVKKQREMGIQILRHLKKRCICCSSNSCAGNCVASGMQQSPACYHCLGNHTAKNCPRDYRSILNGKACFSCYVYNYSEDVVHSHNECRVEGEIQERLRGLIHYDYNDKKKTNTSVDFKKHLSGIFADSETFFSFLYKYRKNMK